VNALELHVHHDAEDLARGAADALATELGWVIRRRGRVSFAVSGGTTPLLMFEALSRHPIDWEHVEIFQVDERCVAEDDDARSLKQLRAILLDVVPIPEANVHAIPIGNDHDASVREYAATVQRVTGGELDIVHLGLGADGHTGSLVPGDPVLSVDDRLVAATDEYQGTRRITLTYPALRAARRIIWVIEGAAKAAALHRLVAGDDSIPAGRVPQDRATVHCDETAVSSLLGGK
jgi:6-phosphogluconolactonase